VASLSRALRGLLLLVAWLPVAAAAERSYIPLPAFDTDPNSGQTYGVLPVILFRDELDHVRHIVAPSLTYNQIRGVTGTFRYFGYPSPGERIDLIAGYSSTIERKLELHYRNLGLFGNRFHADLRFIHDRDAAVRFFGLGPESRLEDETNMTLGVTGVHLVMGVNLTPTARLSLGETVQRFDVRRGGIPELPFTRDVFPDLPGVRGATVHAQRVILTYDSRDSQTTPGRGTTLSLFAETSSELLGSASDYIKSGIDVVHLRPFWDERVVVVVRGLVEALSGDRDTPFEVRPTLGGGSTLRGFSTDRFYGNARMLVNLESRIRLFKLRIFGVTAEFQAAPFVDAGTVFNSVGEFASEGFEVTPGFGLRGLVPPSVVGHIEVGLSREGVAIFVGLDYPF
jgi:outer membrane protein assembly factor BamA